MKVNATFPEKLDFLFQPHRYKVAYGGRGSGKSWSFARALLIKAANEPTRVLCAREIQKSIKQSVHTLLNDQIQSLGLGAFYEVLESEIRGINGSTFSFTGLATNTVESIKSFEGCDIVWVEEAQTVSKKSWDILIPTIRKPDSELWFTWNPRNSTDPIDALLRGPNLPPSAIVKEVNFRDNPWFPDVLKAEMEYDRDRDPDKYKHVWLGSYLSNSEARVFRNWTVEEFEAPEDATHRFGADWGFATDPTVLVRCHLIGRKLYVDYEAYMVGCEIVNTPDLFLTIPESEKWPIVADNARPETISHMKKKKYKQGSMIWSGTKVNIPKK